MRLTRLFLVFGLCVVAPAAGRRTVIRSGALASCGFPACYLDLLGLACLAAPAFEQVTATCGASACPTPTTTMPPRKQSTCATATAVKMIMAIDMSNPQVETSTSTVEEGLGCLLHDGRLRWTERLCNEVAPP